MKGTALKFVLNSGNERLFSGVGCIHIFPLADTFAVILPVFGSPIKSSPWWPIGSFWGLVKVPSSQIRAE